MLIALFFLRNLILAFAVSMQEFYIFLMHSIPLSIGSSKPSLVHSVGNVIALLSIIQTLKILSILVSLWIPYAIFRYLFRKMIHNGQIADVLEYKKSNNF